MAENALKKQEQQGSGKKIAVIIFIILLIALNAFQAWWKHDTDNKNQAIIEEKSSEITTQEAELDSIRLVIEEKIQIALALGEDTTRLGEIKRQLEVDLKKSKNWAYSLSRKNKDLNGKVSAYKDMLDKYETDLEAQRKINEELNVENTALKVTITERNDTINTLTKKKTELEKTVAEAKILSAIEFNVIGVNSKGRQKESDLYKAKWLDAILVQFKLDANKVAKLDNKTVYLVVKNPAGTTIYDEGSGGGVFEFEGNELFYSAKQDVQYEREGKAIEFNFSNPNLYESGNQKVEVYCEGKLIGSSTFGIK